MKRKDSKHKNTETRKRQIISAALKCFTEKGYDSTTMADICAAAGASTGSVYHHFRSKDNLASAVYSTGIADYHARILKALEEGPTAEVSVKAVACAHIGWVADNPDWSKFLFENSQAYFMTESQEVIAALNVDFSKRIYKWVTAHVKDGSLRPVPVDLFIALILGPCQEYSRLLVDAHTMTKADEAVGIIGDLIWRAMAPDK